jgi:hypothetical protein
MKMVEDGAAAQRIDPASKMTIEATKTGLTGRKEYNFPSVGCKDINGRRYAL